MAKQKPGVYDRVLECAKEEFLSRGFLDASLRTIAQEAETSTGSIYTRFGDKEGLFRAIAEPVVDEFKDMFRKVQECRCYTLCIFFLKTSSITHYLISSPDFLE